MTEPTLIYRSDLAEIWCSDALANPDLWTGADVLVTDPPYGMAFRSNRRTASARADHIIGDDNIGAREDCLDLWGTKPALVFGTWKQPRPWGTRNVITWCKGRTGNGMGDLRQPFGTVTEEIYVLGDWSGHQSSRMGNYIVTNEQLSGSHGLVRRIGHPTPKPLELMAQLIERCPPGVIADPFMGSGSTLVAAVQAGRRCVGIELDPTYAAIAVNRVMVAELAMAVAA